MSIELKIGKCEIVKREEEGILYEEIVSNDDGYYNIGSIGFGKAKEHYPLANIMTILHRCLYIKTGNNDDVLFHFTNDTIRDLKETLELYKKERDKHSFLEEHIYLLEYMIPKMHKALNEYRDEATIAIIF